MRAVTLEASIGELSPGGEGVAICEIAGERRAVFVSGVVRGERVEVEADLSRRPARARLLRVLDASPSRIPSPCRHVDRCGGCDWMHIAPTEQAIEHSRIVGRLLGLTIDPQTQIHRSTQELGYRTRARVHIEVKKGRVIAGMYARRSHEPAAVDTCIVLDPILDRTRAGLASWLEGARGHGEAQLSLGRPTATAETRQAVLDLRWSGELPAAVFGRFERATLGTAQAPALLAGVRIFSGDVRVPAKIGDPTPHILGADGEPLRLAPGGFSQATEATNTTLARRVAELVRECAPGPCFELYAGAGNLTVLLARDREVVAVEQDHDACVAARENLATRGLVARVTEADAATFAIPKAASVVVLDPPRDGARTATEALALRIRTQRQRAPSIVYVSCDPPTLARDVQALTAAGYVLRSAETFEMFPHTSHVETIAVLVPGPPREAP